MWDIDLVNNLKRNSMKETLEEAAENYENIHGGSYSIGVGKAFKCGAEWKAEKMYSEEDMKKAYERGMFAIIETGHGDTFEEWFKQFKKK
jgi:hypothetical protein